MHQESTANHGLKNEYEPRSLMRTFTGVISSLLFMGVPVGLCEAFRAGGDKNVALICGGASIIAIVLAVFSIKGTLKQ